MSTQQKCCSLVAGRIRLINYLLIGIFAGTVQVEAANYNSVNLVSGGTRTPYNLVGSASLGQTFCANDGFTTLGITSESWDDDNGGWTLTLWDSPTKNTKYAEKKCDTTPDDFTIYLNFPELPQGSYYWEITEPVGYQSSSVGVWGRQDSSYTQGDGYKNGSKLTSPEADFETQIGRLTFQTNLATEIVLGETKELVEDTAASELKKYLDNLLGINLSIQDLNTTVIKDKETILIGTPADNSVINTLSSQLGLGGIKNDGYLGLSDIKNDGYVVQVVRHENKDILVIASNETRGVLYGVYALLEDLGIVLRVNEDIIPGAGDFTFRGIIRKEPFYKYRAGGALDVYLCFWKDIPYDGIQDMWKWYAQNGMNTFYYHMLSPNFATVPKINDFAGTCLGEFIYYEDYPALGWEAKHGEIISKGRDFLNYLIQSGKEWGIDIILSGYEPGYPEGLLEAYPEIKGNHYPCAANSDFWEFTENKFKELFTAFPGLKGYTFIVTETRRGAIINSRCDLCCGTTKEDKDNWIIKQWERPGLMCQHTNDAIKSVAPDALAIFRLHSLVFNNALQFSDWDPDKNNPLMNPTVPNDVIMIARPHDFDLVSNAGHNRFTGVCFSPHKEGLHSWGGEYMGRESIPCAVVEEYSSGKARIPVFADRKVDELLWAGSFYFPGWNGPAGECLGVNVMNQDHWAQLAWEPFKETDRIWHDWSKRYFPNAEQEMIDVMRPSYQMMYNLGYEGDLALYTSRFAFTGEASAAYPGVRIQTDLRNIPWSSVLAMDDAYNIASNMYNNLTAISGQLGPVDYAGIEKYLSETKKFCEFWTNAARTHYYYYNYNETELRTALEALRDLTPTLDFPASPSVDLEHLTITAPVSYKRNCPAFIASASEKLPDSPDYAYPLIDMYKFEDYHVDEGVVYEPPYISAVLTDIGTGIDYSSIDMKLDGNSVGVSEYTLIKDALLLNPSFEIEKEAFEKKIPKEWIFSAASDRTIAIEETGTRDYLNTQRNTAVRLYSGNTLGQSFTAAHSFDKAGGEFPTWFTTDSGVTLTLKTGPDGTIIASDIFSNVVDNAWVFLSVPTQPAGTYYLEMTNPVGTIGWWTHSDNVYAGGEAYSNAIGSGSGDVEYSAEKNGDNTEHSGTDCIKIEGTGIVGFWMTENGITVNNGTQYKYSCWIKPENVSGTGAYLRVREYDGNSNLTVDSGVQGAVTGTQGWMNKEYVFTTSPDTEKVILMLCFDGSGSVLFDDVIFAPVSGDGSTNQHMITYIPEEPITKGERTLTIDVADNAGNFAPQSKASFNFGSFCAERPYMDFSGDCIVDFADFAIFAEAWLECGLVPDCLP